MFQNFLEIIWFNLSLHLVRDRFNLIMAICLHFIHCSCYVFQGDEILNSRLNIWIQSFLNLSHQALLYFLSKEQLLATSIIDLSRRGKPERLPYGLAVLG